MKILVTDSLASEGLEIFKQAEGFEVDVKVGLKPDELKVIAAVVVGLARQLHGDLARARGLLIGPGEMGELIVEQLRRAGLGRLTVAHGSARRAAVSASSRSSPMRPISARGTHLPAASH